MKRLLLSLVCTVSLSISGQQIQMKPKVMIVPDESYCINMGFYKLDEQRQKIADYRLAMLDDNILNVINTFENLMAEYGFQLTNLQQTLDELKEENVLDNILVSKDNSYIVEDDLDKISRVAQADILVKISPKVSKFGPEQRIELRVSSIDCASKKALKSFGPVIKTSASSITMLLKSAVTDNIEWFASGLNEYFERIKDKGREGSVIIKLAESCPINLESEIVYNGEKGELSDLIEMWFSENTIAGTYTGTKLSRYSMKFDQVHIPLTSKVAFGRERAITMEGFVKSGLIQLLNEYGISVSTHPIGIGRVYMILGELK